MSKIYLTGQYDSTIALTSGNTTYFYGNVKVPVGGGDGIFSNASDAGLFIGNNIYVKAGYNAASGGSVGIGVDLKTPTTFTNYGTVYGGKSYSAANGGAGAYLHGGTLTNKSGAHIGGGGNGDASGNTAAGGTGVTANNASLYNAGKIAGGYGGSNGMSAGGVGGSGVNLLGTATLDNTGAGTILAGRGGHFILYGPTNETAFATGNGGAGVEISSSSASLTNSAQITGGSGAIGGAGVDIAASAGTQTAPTTPALYNGVSGTITGGGGFNSIPGPSLGGAGISVEAQNALLTNHGTVTGGGTSHGYGYTGGAGIDLTGAQAVAHNYGTISGGQGPEIGGAGADVSYGTLTNAGTIDGGAGSMIGGTGVDLIGGGTGANPTPNYLSNTSAGVINGVNGAAGVSFTSSTGYVALSGKYGVIYNAGTIQGGNSQSGSMAGGDGIDIGTQTNFVTDLDDTGKIQAGNALANGTDTSGGGGIGIYLSAGDLAYVSGTASGGSGYGNGVGGAAASVKYGSFLVVNNGGQLQGGSGGTLGDGGAGVYMYGGNLSLFSATISGGAAGAQGGIAGDAVQLNGEGNTLDVSEAVIFHGNVVGGYGNLDSLNLEGSYDSTLTGLGAQITGFDTLNFEGSNWTVQSASHAAVSTNSSQPAPVKFTNFDMTDTLDVTDLSFAAVQNSTLSYANGVLDIATGAGNYYLDIQAVGGSQFQLAADSGDGTDITLVPCYLRGTKILTERGESAIEALAIGDRIVTLSGIVRPIKWIGHRRYSRGCVRANPEIMPIKIAQGALGSGLPSRDLWVSPEHAMLLDGMLIPAVALVNGTSITQDDDVGEVTYFHLEFDSHTVIFAEGAPAESFVEDASRWMFDNAAEYSMLYPDAVEKPARLCAPRVDEGHEMGSVRSRLALQSATRLAGSLQL